MEILCFSIYAQALFRPQQVGPLAVGLRKAPIVLNGAKQVVLLLESCLALLRRLELVTFVGEEHEPLIPIYILNLVTESTKGNSSRSSQAES